MVLVVMVMVEKGAFYRPGKLGAVGARATSSCRVRHGSTRGRRRAAGKRQGGRVGGCKGGRGRAVAVGAGSGALWSARGGAGPGRSQGARRWVRVRVGQGNGDAVVG